MNLLNLPMKKMNNGNGALSKLITDENLQQSDKKHTNLKLDRKD
jgi:hypothetical protein